MPSEQPKASALTAVAEATVPGGRSKDLRTVKVIMQTACCYREHKFKPEDSRAKCHLGLAKIDFGICANCIWFGVVTGSERAKLLSGGEAMAVASLLRSLRETHDAETGRQVAPEMAIPTQATEEARG